MPKPKAHTPLTLECLEERVLLAGIVTAEWGTKGRLFIQGDNASNSFSVYQQADVVRIEGIDGTLVAGRSSFPASSIKRIHVAGLDGDDSIHLGSLPGRVSVDGGAGVDRVLRTALRSFRGNLVEQADVFGDGALTSAVALTNTTVLVHFSRPLAKGSDKTSSFLIESPNLEVTGVQLNTDRTSAVLTTSSQENLLYSIRVRDLTTRDNKLLDPTRNSATFSGIAPPDLTAPELLSAASTSATAVALLFSEPLSADAASLMNFEITPRLALTSVAFGDQANQIVLGTLPQAAGTTYTVKAANVRDLVRNEIHPGANSAEFQFMGQSGLIDSDLLPRVVGAASTGNTAVLVAFNKPMGDSALLPQHYVIVQENVNPEAGVLLVSRVQFVRVDRTAVQLETASQNELTYTVAVVGVQDMVGNSLGPRVTSQGLVVDPTRASFPGTPPSGQTLVDSDGDGLTDNEEQRGWIVTTKLANGTTSVRGVTSDPFHPDSDGDGFSDREEATLRLDPRDPDTDDDQLGDAQEFNHIFSDPANQDSDGDGLDDGLEFHFFRTSVVHADTDGDQIPDGDEVLLANRNPRVADLPSPTIEIGAVNLRLDVRFTATSAKATRELETQTVESTLTQTETQTFSNTDSDSHEFMVKIGVEQGWSVGEAGIAAAKGKFTAETSYTGQWTSSFTRETSEETQRAVAESFSTEKEVTQEETLTREIVGAQMQVGVDVKSVGDIAFAIRNLQITVFLQDPRNPGRLLPIATLVPDANVPNEFNLGPLVPQRGPFIFTNDQIFPSLVQDLMLDPRGLVFKVANFDLTDELGRNFAFTSQNINDRTAPLVIDFGGADTDGDGEGDITERFRVATSAGRPIEDTNGDGSVDDDDDRVVFNDNGKAVGITLREALEGILGLKHFDEDQSPASSLDPSELANSYSTRMIQGVETLWRIRGISKELNNPLKQWVVLTTDGIDPTLSFSDRVLLPGKGITLAFTQDLDNDLVPATWEFVHGCSDTTKDTDGDGLDDGFEFLTGWTVDVAGRGSFKVFASCAREDSDLDGITDADEYGRFVDIDTDGDGTPEFTNVRKSTDPKNPDTDKDGITDFDEINGYQVDLRFPNSLGATKITVTTDPLNPDSDGDTLKDGAERTLGTDPTTNDKDKVLDNDRDGLVNFEEQTVGWTVTYYQVSTTALTEGTAVTLQVTSNINDSDSDNDGLSDKQERTLGTNPNVKDTDGDGLDDNVEVEVTVLPNGTDSFTLLTDPLDADTDDDKRSDGAEVSTSWSVAVTGETPYSVFSDPNVADADLDTLVDGDEIVNGTDPTQFDTDGDNAGIGDARELALGTLPLRPDQKVSFRFTQIQLLGGICDPSTHSEGEFTGEIKLRNPDGSDVSIISYTDRGMEEGDTIDVSVTKELVLTAGQSVRIFSTGTFENDDTSSGFSPGDDDINEFSQDFTFQISTQTVNLENLEPSGDCKLVMTVIITVLT